MTRLPFSARLAVLLLAALPLAAAPVPAQDAAAPAVRNVIVMIPDGTTVAVATLARWVRGGGPLAMDATICGLVRTYSSDAAIADSAPAATAMATGHKSHTGCVGVLPAVADMPGLEPIPAGEEGRPVANLMEAARLAGKATGLACTCEVMHATPAGFSAHAASRSDYDTIAEQQVHAGLDVVLGGGAQFLLPSARKDKADLVAAIRSRGYAYATNREELAKASGGKLWGAFAPKDIPNDLDRPPNVPSLAEMTAKAIDVLSRDPDGFLLMVEGSKVDWAAHANQPVAAVSEMLSFDDAVAVALEFARRDGATAVIIAPDHGTGGLSFGSHETDKGYDTARVEDFVRHIRLAKRTEPCVAAMLNPSMGMDEAKAVVSEFYGVADLSDAEAARLLEAVKAGDGGQTAAALRDFMNKRSRLGWTTGGHTGEDVFLGVHAPGWRPTGVIENTDIAASAARYLGLDLDAATERLFAEAKELFRPSGADMAEAAPETGDDTLTASKGGRSLTFHVNRNVAELDGAPVALEGFAVRSGGKWYVPRHAAALLP